jgi:hypothetical protein
MSTSMMPSVDSSEPAGASVVWVGGYLITAAALLVLVAVGSDAVRWYSLTLLVAGAVILVIRREAHVYGMVDLSNPVVMSLLGSVVFFGLLGAPNVFSSAGHHPLLAPGDGPLFRALGTVGLSMLCLWVGSRLAEPLFRARPERLSQLWAQVRQQRVLAVVAVGVLARLLLLVSGNLGYQRYGTSGGDLTGYANWLATASDLLPFAAGLFLVDWFTTRRRTSLRAVVILFVAEVGTSLVAGVKGLALTLVVFLTVVAIRAGRRPSLRVAVTAGILFLVVIAPSVQAYRLQVSRSGGAPSSIAQRVTAPLSLVGVTSGNSFGAARTSYHNTVYEEQNLLVDIALIQSRTPSIYPYAHGKRWLQAPLLAAIPRALWPGKPALSNGGEIAVRYGGNAPGTSMPTTMVGDAWIQFGWLGVIAASLLLGAVFRLLYTWVVRRGSAGWTTALCFVAAGSLFSGGLDLASLLTSAAREFIVLGLVAAWVLRPAGPSSTTHSAAQAAGQGAA